MNNPNVNVVVSGPKNDCTSTYKTYILRGNMSFADQVTESNRKYVIKYDFDLGGGEVTIPENCILEFDGGSLSNGSILLSNETKIYNGAFFSIKVDILGNNIIIKKSSFNTGSLTPTLINCTHNTSGIVIESCIFDSYSYIGEFTAVGNINIQDCENIKILNCSFKGGWNDKRYNSSTDYSGYNISRTINANIHGRSNIEIDGCVAESVWTFAYIANCNNLSITNNIVSNTADTAIFDRCTSGTTKGKYIAGNKLLNIGKSGIKTLDTNNTTAKGTDSIVVNNIIDGFGVFTNSGAINAATNYGSSYNASDSIRQENLIVKGNIIKNYKSTILLQLYNIDNLHFIDNIIISPNAGREFNTLCISCNGVISSNTFDIKGALNIDVFKSLIVSNNKIIADYVNIENALNTINDTIIFTSNTLDVINNNKDEYWAINTARSKAKLSTSIENNTIIIPSAYTDTVQTSSKNVFNLRNDSKFTVNRNYIIYSDKSVYSSIPFGNQVHPVYYKVLKGTSIVDNDGMIMYAPNDSGGGTDAQNNTRILEPILFGDSSQRPIPSVYNLQKTGLKYFDTTLNKPIHWNGTRWVDENGFTAARNKGTTAQRPSGTGSEGGILATSDIGFMYYDTDLGKPIFYKTKTGAGVITWVDATGTPV